MGHLVPFGCCEEKLLVEIYGTRGRGAPSDPPFDHTTGEGRVDARVGYYADAIHKKKNTVVMILANPFGGMHSTGRRRGRGGGSLAFFVRFSSSSPLISIIIHAHSSQFSFISVRTSARSPPPSVSLQS